MTNGPSFGNLETSTKTMEQPTSEVKISDSCHVRPTVVLAGRNHSGGSGAPLVRCANHWKRNLPRSALASLQVQPDKRIQAVPVLFQFTTRSQ
jgi:hypothetical protein